MEKLGLKFCLGPFLQVQPGSFSRDPIPIVSFRRNLIESVQSHKAVSSILILLEFICYLYSSETLLIASSITAS